MTIMNKLLILLVALLPATVVAQNFKITVKFSNYKPQKVRLAHFFEDKQYLDIDSAHQSGNTVWFEGEGELYPGIYSIILNDSNTSFEFLVDHNNQFITFKCDANDMQKTMKVSGSDVNAKFYDYQRSMTTLIRKKIEIDSALKRTPNDSVALKSQRKDIEKQTTDLLDNTIQKNQGTILADVLNCMDAYSYQGDEMYAHVNFAQKGLIRTPFYQKMLYAHLARSIEKGSAEILKQNDILIERTKADIDMYHYTTGYLLNFYRTFFKAGINEVFVRMADKYFLADTVKDINPENKRMIKEQRDIYASSMQGAIAHPIRMAKTLTGDSIDVLDAHKGKLFLLFWSNGCGHCDSAENALIKYYEGLVRNNITIISVNNDKHSPELIRADTKKKNFPWLDVSDSNDNSRYREYYYVVSTPILYVIDENRRIIRKAIGEDRITELAFSMSR